MNKIKDIIHKIWAYLWMENTAYLNLLTYLLPYGIGFETDVVPAFVLFIKKGEGPNNKEWKKSVNTTVGILSQMRKNGHVSYNENQDFLDLVTKGEHFYASISTAGFEFLDKYQSNKSVKITNKVVIFNLIGAAIFSMATILISISNINIAKDNLEFEKQNAKGLLGIDNRLDTLTLQQSKMSKALKLIQTSQTSPKRKH